MAIIYQEPFKFFKRIFEKTESIVYLTATVFGNEISSSIEALLSQKVGLSVRLLIADYNLSEELKAKLTSISDRHEGLEVKVLSFYSGSSKILLVRNSCIIDNRYVLEGFTDISLPKKSASIISSLYFSEESVDVINAVLAFEDIWKKGISIRSFNMEEVKSSRKESEKETMAINAVTLPQEHNYTAKSVYEIDHVENYKYLDGVLYIQNVEVYENIFNPNILICKIKPTHTNFPQTLNVEFNVGDFVDLLKRNMQIHKVWVTYGQKLPLPLVNTLVSKLRFSGRYNILKSEVEPCKFKIASTEYSDVKFDSVDGIQLVDFILLKRGQSLPYLSTRTI